MSGAGDDPLRPWQKHLTWALDAISKLVTVVGGSAAGVYFLLDQLLD